MTVGILFIADCGHFYIWLWAFCNNGGVYILLWAFCIVVGVYKLWWAFLYMAMGVL
jgi:hypothetical protein